MTVMLISASFIDNRFMPYLDEISVIKAKETANRCIDTAVRETLNEMDREYTEFFISDGINDTFSINTMLINEVTYKTNEKIINRLNDFETIRINIPLGTISDIGFIASSGPEISLKMIPYGETVTDYETEIVSSGINQTSVKVWIETSVTIKIIHPLIEKKAVINRKIMLVDTVIKGDVPGGYILDVE